MQQFFPESGFRTPESGREAATWTYREKSFRKTS